MRRAPSVPSRSIPQHNRFASSTRRSSTSISISGTSPRRPPSCGMRVCRFRSNLSATLTLPPASVSLLRYGRSILVANSCGGPAQSLTPNCRNSTTRPMPSFSRRAARICQTSCWRPWQPACRSPVRVAVRCPKSWETAACISIRCAPREIVAAIRQLCLAPEKRERIASRAHERAQMFSWSRCAQETFEFLAGVLHAHRDRYSPIKDKTVSASAVGRVIFPLTPSRLRSG